MSSFVFVMVLCAALLHAGWNIIVKGGEDKLNETALNATGAGLGSLLILPCVPLPPSECWLLLGLSCLGHLVYYLSMADTYESGELTLCYPVMRGCAPFFTALILCFFGEELPASGWAGLAALCMGVVALATPTGNNQRNIRGLLLAVRTSLLVALYTLADGFGARLAGSSLSYTAWLFFLNMFPIVALVSLRGRSRFWSYFKNRARVGLPGGLCSLGSYSIAIWAMTVAPIAMVEALRETSPIFGLILAVMFLKEMLNAQRVVAVLLVCLGAAIFRIG